MTKTIGYASFSPNDKLSVYSFERRDLRRDDVKIKILFCGICHSDLHTARNEWRGTIYPCVPGHEIIGEVIEVGSDVSEFKIGQLVGVGCMVDSCQKCASCEDHEEQYCEKGATYTYNSRDQVDGSITYGGYSDAIVVNKKFVLSISKEFNKEDLPNVAPLLCAGITTYSPLRFWNIGKNSKIGVVGLGGLGHMAIKISDAMGAHVILFTTSPNKVDDAKRLGADEVVNSKDNNEMKKYINSLDFILDTVSVAHNLDSYLELLKKGGTLCLLGAPPTPHPTPNFGNLIFKRRCIGGSLIGGIKETQEMLNFCAQNKIVSDIEMIPIQNINEAYERMLKSDVKYRFVIDMSSLGKEKKD